MKNPNNTKCNLPQNREKLHTYLLETRSWMIGEATWRQKLEREVVEKQTWEKHQRENGNGGFRPKENPLTFGGGLKTASKGKIGQNGAVPLIGTVLFSRSGGKIPAQCFNSGSKTVAKNRSNQKGESFPAQLEPPGTLAAVYKPSLKRTYQTGWKTSSPSSYWTLFVAVRKRR